jgi:4-hydroxybenzoate polyprenyltransferase
MKWRTLAIWLILFLSLLPAFYINRYLQRSMRPRESAARFFLFLLTNFIMVLLYTMIVVGLIGKMFRVKG